MRTALVTGTSTGIGQAAVLELARRGWRVFATMRNLEKRKPLEALLAETGCSRNVELVRLDVTDAGSIGPAVEAVLAASGGALDAVVHNAGVAVGAAFEDLAEEEARRVMETNFFGVLALTRALLPTFRAQRRGRIVIVSSDSAFFGQPANAVYCASKWAIEGWAESVAYELAPFGIDIVLIEPGPYRTSIWENSPRIAPVESPYGLWLQQVYQLVDAHVSATARDPHEVARAIGRVLEARRPRFRNPVGRIARLNCYLRGKVPVRLARWGTMRYLNSRATRPRTAR
jgi:NAD(P)-dependent dehydrogenase (short-subunit alcohol dehydrogenase family)